MKTSSPARAARDARRELARLARPGAAFDASRYFRGAGNLGFYNVGTDRVRAMARTVVAVHKGTWTIADAMAFADILMADRFLEAKGLAIEVVARFRRAFHRRLLVGWKRWLARNQSANWATTDAICGLLTGPLLLDYPQLLSSVARWARHPNMWVRRASAVSLIPSARRGIGLDAAYGVARALHPDHEDLIQKAAGWLLREAGKTDPTRLERYLRTNGPAIPRTTVRYAIERFSLAKRRQLLHATIKQR